MSFKAEDLRVGDVVSKPQGHLGQPWSHEVVKLLANTIETRFNESIDRGRMSLTNMQTCLDQEGTVVHRDGKQIYPVLETAHTDADLSANSNREDTNQ